MIDDKSKSAPIFNLKTTSISNLIFVGLIIKHDFGSARRDLAKLCRDELYRRKPGSAVETLGDEPSAT